MHPTVESTSILRDTEYALKNISHPNSKSAIVRFLDTIDLTVFMMTLRALYDPNVKLPKVYVIMAKLLAKIMYITDRIDTLKIYLNLNQILKALIEFSEGTRDQLGDEEIKLAKMFVRLWYCLGCPTRELVP